MATEAAIGGGTMRAVVCAGAGEARIEERPIPRPRPGELLLEMACCGLCGTDLFKLRHGSVDPGTVLGHELVGKVALAGGGTSRFAPGTRLAVPHHVSCGDCPLCLRGSETLCPVFRVNLFEPGGFSEYVLLRERAVELAALALPEGLSEEAAAFLEPAACVLRGIHRSGLAGETSAAAREVSVAILGAGSMGLLHLLVLRALYPAIRVLVSDPLPQRRELAERMGADLTAPPDRVGDAMEELSNGLGAEAVFDTVGGAEQIDTALRLTREGGATVLFAHAQPGERAAFELNRIFRHEKRLLGTYSSSLREQRQAFSLLTSKRLDPAPLVTHRLGLSRFPEAVELAAGREALKILLHPDPR